MAIEQLDGTLVAEGNDFNTAMHLAHDIRTRIPDLNNMVLMDVIRFVVLDIMTGGGEDITDEQRGTLENVTVTAAKSLGMATRYAAVTTKVEGKA